MKIRYGSDSRRAVLTLSAVCLWGLAASGTEVVWNSALDGLWSDSSKWTPAQVPSTNDVAVITNSGSYTVTLNVNPVVAGLALGGSSGTQTVAVAGRTLTLGGTASVGSNGRLFLNGGILAGTGVYEVEGIMDWLAGELAADTTLQIAESGYCIIASGPKYGKTIGGTLYNAGTTRWGPNGSLVVNGMLHNRTNGVFDVYNDNSSISCYTTDGVIVNDGLFRKTGGSANINFYLPVINRGTMDVTNGTFTLLEGSELHDGCAFTGAGKTLLTGETNRMHGTFYSENLNLRYSATMTGTGTVSGAMVWGGGTMDEACRLTVATNGHLTIFSEFQHGKILYGTLNNLGSVTVQSLGNFYIEGALENRPGGVVDVVSDNVTISSTVGDAYILNEGLIRKSAGGIGNNCYAAVTNSGTVQIQTGKLRFINGYSNPGGTILLEGGAFQSDDPLDLESGGLLAGWGTLYNAVSNSATVRPARTNGTLTVSGDYTQTLTGKTVFELAGNTPGVNQSRLDVTGDACLAGYIEIERPTGFLPVPGTNFTVMSYASRTGNFDFEDGFYLLGHDRHLESAYTPAELILSTIAASDPDPGDIPFGIAADDDVLMVAWPKEFTGYDLQSKTNLNQSQWELISGVTNLYMEWPPFSASRFFRLTTP